MISPLSHFRTFRSACRALVMGGLALPFLLGAMATGGLAQKSGQSACSGPRDNQAVRMRMINGTRARLQNWPGQVAIFKALAGYDFKESQQFCGGTQIAPQWVLTAAHCFANYCDKGRCPINRNGFFTDYKWHGDLYELEVVLGTDDLGRIEEKNRRRISQIVMHPEYDNAETSGRDIALVKLDRPWTDGVIARLSLSERTDPQPDRAGNVMVSGFGLKKPGVHNEQRYTRVDGSVYRAGSSHLQEVLVPVVSKGVCKNRYNSQHITNGQICAGFQAGRYDACSGDSGGQMVAFDKEGCPYQVGIVSWGDGCAKEDSFGVYTRVSYHKKWIEGHVGRLRKVDEAQVASLNLPEMQRSMAFASAEDLKQQLAPTGGRVRLIMPSGHRVKLGELRTFEVESDVSGRLIIFDIDATGKITQLFPNGYLKSLDQEFIRAGQRIKVPGKDYGFAGFQAIPPLGPGRVVAVVVPEEFKRSLVAPETRRSRGFVAVKDPKDFSSEPMPTVFFANLLDQIRQITRNMSNDKVNDIAISVAEYELVK